MPKSIQHLTIEEQQKIVTQKAIHFFDLYREEIKLIQELFQVKLNQIALAYTQKNNIQPKVLK